ncbi:MAG: acetylglutamate kinase [Candidatus Thermoplasmatota archaeon]
MTDEIKSRRTGSRKETYLNELESNTKRIVIKYGGNAMLDETLKKSVAEDIVRLKNNGLNPIIVHGGGPAVSKQMDKEGKEPEFIQGQRKTDEETLEIAEMVLSGKVNKNLVGLINEKQGKAVGISGKDGHLVKSKKQKKEIEINGKIKKTDLGRVGQVQKVNTKLIETLIDKGFIPVISPICAGEDEGDFNVNADILAGEIASSINADSLIYLTNVDGIQEEKNDKDSRIKNLNIKKAESMIGTVIKGGMIPKVESAIKAIKDGVKNARIIDGTIQHSLIDSLEKNSNNGTILYSNKGEIN